MKSKKIVAVVVALLTFMAVATSGLAAVTTTTTYNTDSGKVEVVVEVTEATPSSEVTYLVESNDKIVYIDQKTADVSGNVGFNYKIEKSKIVNLTTNVQFGTNGAATISGDDEEIQLDNVVVTSNGHATVGFFKDVACEGSIGKNAVIGDGDNIYAKVTLETGYEIKEVSGLEETGSVNVYAVKSKNISITTIQTSVAPGIEEPSQDELKGLIKESVEVEVEGQTVSATKYTKVFKVVGQPKEVGVEYNNESYKALPLNDAYVNGELYAVGIIVNNDVEINELPTYIEVAEVE